MLAMSWVGADSRKLATRAPTPRFSSSVAGFPSSSQGTATSGALTSCAANWRLPATPSSTVVTFSHLRQLPPPLSGPSGQVADPISPLQVSSWLYLTQRRLVSVWPPAVTYCPVAGFMCPALPSAPHTTVFPMTCAPGHTADGTHET